MTMLKNALYILVAVAVAGVAVQMIAPSELMAQVRAALIRDVDHPARQAVTIRRNTSNSIFENVYTVPAGKTLVVEHMNCSALGTDALYVGLFLQSLAHANIVYSVPFTGDGIVRILDGQTRLYFDPGTSIFLRIFTSDNTTCTISGHTVDAT